MSKYKDYTGYSNGIYTVVCRAEDYVSPSGHKHTRWECQCCCGNTFYVLGDNICRTKSCGHLQRELGKDRGLSNRRHGDACGNSRTRLYRIWSGMKSHCYNKNSLQYSRYGGRGISICDEWRNNYGAFKEWALDNGYTDSLSIDRVDNNSGYRPDNCRWATPKEQSNNLRTNRHIVVHGETLTVQQACERWGALHSTVLKEINAGWSDERIVERHEVK